LTKVKPVPGAARAEAPRSADTPEGRRAPSDRSPFHQPGALRYSGV